MKLIWPILIVGIAGCSGGSGDRVGSEGNPCYPNETCNEGLLCTNSVCVEDVGTSGNACYEDGTCNSGLFCFDGEYCGDPEADGGPGPRDAALPDARITIDSGPGSADAMMITCSDDSENEPNGTQNTATVAGTLGPMASVVILGLAVCPASDIDFFSFTISESGNNVEVDIGFDSAYGVLLLSVQNGVGASIATGASVPGDMDKRRATIANLPAGTYFASVSSPAFIPNNYSLEIRSEP